MIGFAKFVSALLVVLAVVVLVVGVVGAVVWCREKGKANLVAAAEGTDSDLDAAMAEARGSVYTSSKALWDAQMRVINSRTELYRLQSQRAARHESEPSTADYWTMASIWLGSVVTAAVLTALAMALRLMAKRLSEPAARHSCSAPTDPLQDQPD